MFDSRSTELEIMDELTLGGEAMDQTLRELKFINKWLGGNYVTTNGLYKLYKEYKRNTNSGIIHIADLGCGGGDMLILMAEWARKNNVKVQFTGIDANEYIINYAKQNTKHYPEISYKVLDIFSPEFSRHYFDIITCTLFCHHFTDQQLITLFSQLRQQAQVGIVINDLHRHPLAYHSIKWLTQWFSKSYLVKNDAKLSVLRSFRKTDLEHILQQAGIQKSSIGWKWAFRWQVIVNV
jgi:2-polyprenyl-3-methyl-5-hydroxy-6-metoxy-1,4-benzoquinol methylase